MECRGVINNLELPIRLLRVMGSVVCRVCNRLKITGRNIRQSEVNKLKQKVKIQALMNPHGPSGNPSAPFSAILN